MSRTVAVTSIAIGVMTALISGHATAFVNLAGTVNVAEAGQASTAIVLADPPTAAEQTAARELAEYLGKATGGSFEIVAESDTSATGACIHVGPTRYAQEHGLDVDSFGPEEWAIRTTGG
ncbi:MAG: hypothetical protein JXR94_09825, partial [Candidatus Hydrogenedentes bacterium]|nr:hypothetical protein [Candidatus Hydrogenedentota bacterium]